MLNRREFLIAGGALAIVPLPTIAAPPRAAFLEVRDDVSFLYFEDWVRPSQPHSISARVEHVGAWNGAAYPIVLSYYVHKHVEYWDGVDSEWCMFRKELPNFSWRDVPLGRYPNIHAYVREKRFGEDPSRMAAQMNHNLLHGVTFAGQTRGSVPVRKTLFA